MTTDPVKWHGKQFKQVASRANARWLQHRITKAMHSIWGKEKSPLLHSDHLQLLIRSSRMLHNCRLPFLFEAPNSLISVPAAPPSSSSPKASTPPSPFPLLFNFGARLTLPICGSQSPDFNGGPKITSLEKSKRTGALLEVRFSSSHPPADLRSAIWMSMFRTFAS